MAVDGIGPIGPSPENSGASIASGGGRRYFLMLYADDHTNDLYWPVLAADDGAMIRQLGELGPLVDAYPAGEVWTEAGTLIWRKGALDG